MKTLDELIHSLGYCSDLHNSRCDECDYKNVPLCRVEKDADALHYLKEYRNCGACAYADSYLRCTKEDRNDPLSWDELRTMEGKPVWVEILSDEIDLSSRWMMVARETKAHSLPLAYTDDMGHWIYGHEDDLGKTWQAYRKERE